MIAGEILTKSGRCRASTAAHRESAVSWPAGARRRSRRQGRIVAGSRSESAPRHPSRRSLSGGCAATPESHCVSRGGRASVPRSPRGSPARGRPGAVLRAGGHRCGGGRSRWRCQRGSSRHRLPPRDRLRVGLTSPQLRKPLRALGARSMPATPDAQGQSSRSYRSASALP